MADLLNALAQYDGVSAQVLYFRPRAANRSWGNPTGELPYQFADATATAPSLFSATIVSRAVRRTRADIWLVNSCYTAMETWSAVARLNALNKPWVYMNEAWRPRGRADLAKISVLRLLLRRCAGVIGMGELARHAYCTLIARGVPSASVPYYLALEEFFAAQTSVPRDGEPVRFATSSQMIHRKGYDVLFEACEKVRPQAWRLTIAGDGPLRSKLEGHCRARWGEEQVKFLGQLPFNERVRAFEGHHVFVFPSRWDGWGMAPVEAMAAGLPVIASDRVASMSEFIRSGENGYLVANEDPKALAAAMQSMIDTPERIAPMGRAARKALAAYAPAVGAARLLDFLQSVHDAAGQAQQPVIDRSCQVECRPTWRGLNRTGTWRRRTAARFRAMAKKSFIDFAVIARRDKCAPKGNRILAYHLVLREDRMRFSEQIAFLRDHYRLMPLRRLLEADDCGAEAPAVAVTFDDGFRVLLSDALEVLERYGVKATFFVPTGFCERARDPRSAAAFSRRAFYYARHLEPMTPDDLLQLSRLGHEIGSHGVSHIGMDALSRPAALREVRESRMRLTEWLGYAPEGFAYPYGKSQSSICEPRNCIAAAGYGYAVTTRRGAVRKGLDPFLLPRDHSEGCWRVSDLKYFLSR